MPIRHTDGTYSPTWFAPFSVVGDPFSVGKPQLWSPSSLRALTTRSDYDVHPDGKRLATAADRGENTVHDHVPIMSNFFDYPAEDRAREDVSPPRLTVRKPVGRPTDAGCRARFKPEAQILASP